MREGRRASSWGRQWDRIEPVLQDRLHALIAAGMSEDCPFRGGFHALRGVLLRQTNDAETGTIAHFRMRLFAQDALEQLSRVRADGARPVHHARGWPLQMRLMTLGAVLMLGNILPRSRPRTWAATRWPRWKISTVVGVERTSTTCCTSVYGTL